MLVRTSNDELYHFGIKGQKWGVRRYQNPDGSLTNAGRKRYNKEAVKKVREERLKLLESRSTLSDDELKDLLKRLETEKKVKDLIEDDVYPGKRVCKQILENYGKSVIGKYATNATNLLLNVALTKEIDRKKAAKYLTPPPKQK